MPDWVLEGCGYTTMTASLFFFGASLTHLAERDYAASGLSIVSGAVFLWIGKDLVRMALYRLRAKTPMTGDKPK